MAENPLLTALPPASDYLTYLTILEYNLTVDQLPTLHTILQDTTLTANIGWDLVHLLLPLLPASQQCLLDVARLGNPREVVLKVTELLESLGVENEESTDENEEDDIGELGDLHLTENEASRPSIKKAIASPSETAPPKRTGELPSKLSQFIVLLDMLSILHPRIKTKYPSRFLSTSLQAILPVYLQLATEFGAADAVISFIKAICGGGRPKLPPRKSSAVIAVLGKSHIAPDPEGQEDGSGPDESLLQNRLLQSFLTYVIDDFISSAPSAEDIPGLAWSCRLQENLNPDKIIRGREAYVKLFADNEELHERDVIVGQIVALARDIRITPEELISVVTKAEVENDATDSELPSSAADVQLSRTGSLLLLSAFTAASSLFDVQTPMPPMNIFPEYAAIVENFIGDETMNGIGTEKPGFADAVIFLGLFIAHTSKYTSPEDDQTFTSALQRLSLLSANTPSAPLRFNAHILVKKILHSHPSASTRLAFIQDTLHHCPYENLKASAIDWLKDEILSADKPPNSTTTTATPLTSPSTLSTLSPFLFPNPLHTLPPREDYSSFHSHHSFHLATLNLLFLLLTSPSLFHTLNIKSLVSASEIRAQFLVPLRQVAEEVRAQAEGQKGGQKGEEGADKDDDEEIVRELGLLEGMLDMVESAMEEKGV